MIDMLISLTSSPELVVGGLGFCAGLAAGVVLKTQPRRRPPFAPRQPPVIQAAPPKFGQASQCFDPSALASAYNLMISTCTPRPIALVSTRGKTTTDNNATTYMDNVAPFSYFGVVAHDPPMLTIGFCRKGRNRQQKDTLVNILETKEFVVNIMSEWYLDEANHACGNFAPDVDEFVESGLIKLSDSCQVVNAPRCGQAAVAYECQLQHVFPVTNDDGAATTEIVLARIVRIHVDESVLVKNYDPTKPQVDTTQLKPVGRLGGNVYTTLGELVDIPRPQV